VLRACLKEEIKICDSSHRPNWIESIGLFQLYKKTNNKLIKLKINKKSDSKNLGKKYFVQKGKMINLNSQPIKYERTKWGKKEWNKKNYKALCFFKKKIC